jgi:hypothetical protein
MKNFVKLDNSFELSHFKQAALELNRTYDKRQKYNRRIDEGFTLVPVNQYRLSAAVIERLLSQLPQSVLEIEVPQVFVLEMDAPKTLKPVLAPHVDFSRSCGINIYLEASGEVTHYYRWDGVDSTLKEEESFVAGVGDCWLIDTSVPHSVSLVPGKKRKILTFSFVKATYTQIRNAYK